MIKTIIRRLGLKKRILEWKRPRMRRGYTNPDGKVLADIRISDTICLVKPEQIFLADNIFIWHHSILDGSGGLEIGEGTQIGAWVGIFTHSSHLAIRLYGRSYTEVPEAAKKAFVKKPVHIGRYVFIGAGARILPGVTIGDGAIIGAGTIVHKDVEDCQIVSGSPAKVIGDTRKLDAPLLEEFPELRAIYYAPELVHKLLQ